MKRFITLLILVAVTFSACDKSEVQEAAASNLPVTKAVKSGDWMLTYFENNASINMGLTFFKFNSAGTLVATMDGTNYNGTWSETNTGGNNTLTINITTTDTRLKKANGSWKVTGVTEYFIDLKDFSAASNVTIQLMKH